MNEPAARIANLLRHQAAIAGFGSFALRETNLNTILTEAARVCAEGLGASFSKVCRYRDAHHDLIIEAGWGWNQGVIGTVVSATPSSPQGQAFVTRKPSIHNDLPGDKDFSLPPFYVEHGIISIADVVINAKDAERPYGVLEIDSEVPREYDQHDIDFLTGFANVLAEAVATSVRTTVLCTTLDQMKTLVSSLAKSEERLRVVVEAAPNAIILTGADGRIEMVNAEAEHAFGYTRSELIGNHADMLVPSRFRGSNSPVLSATPVQLTGVGRGLFGVRKNGEEFQVEIGFTPIETDEGRKVRLTIVDITDRVQLEGRLRQAQKMEAVGRLTAGVAHDFNNILQGIVGGLELVMDDLKEGTPAHDLANVAINAAMRGASLTQHLLSYSRKQMLRPQPIAIGPFMDDLQKLLARTLGPHIDVQVEVNHAPCLLADPGLLQTALLNLAINASHAMPREGSLRMEAREESAEGSVWVVISIIDTGTGMEESVRAQAVEPFFTTKGMDGSGLGLSMVQGFAEQSGGHMRIMSRLGQGTTIELRLPAAINGAGPEPGADNKTHQAPARILLVDDSTDILVTTGAFLEKSGFKVVRVISGDQALALLADGERFDALVTDHAMPGLNGADLIAEGRAIQPDLPCVIITGFANVNFEHLLPEGTPVLHKPFQRAELMEALNTVMPEIETAEADAKEPVLP